MEREAAEKRAIEEWGSAAVKYLKAERVVLERERTESHEWGWVFYFRPDEPAKDKEYRFCSVAFDRQSDWLVPVGNRGAEFAVLQYRRIRAS